MAITKPMAKNTNGPLVPIAAHFMPTAVMANPRPMRMPHRIPRIG